MTSVVCQLSDSFSAVIACESASSSTESGNFLKNIREHSVLIALETCSTPSKNINISPLYVMANTCIEDHVTTLLACVQLHFYHKNTFVSVLLQPMLYVLSIPHTLRILYCMYFNGLNQHKSTIDHAQPPLLFSHELPLVHKSV